MTTFSVVTPVWNDPRVADAVDSVRALDGGQDVQVIVVDGGSTGPGKEALERIRDHVDILISEPDRGIYDAMNKGVRRATGDFIGILNADDRYVCPDMLDRIEQHAEAGAQATYGDIRIVDGGRTKRRWRAGPYRRGKWRRGWMPPHPSVFVDKAVYEEHGLFRLDCGWAADYEWLLRTMYKGGIAPAYIDETLVEMATGGASTPTPRNVFEGWRRVRQAWRLNGLGGGVVPATCKPLSKVAQMRWTP